MTGTAQGIEGASFRFKPSKMDHTIVPARQTREPVITARMITRMGLPAVSRLGIMPPSLGCRVDFRARSTRCPHRLTIEAKNKLNYFSFAKCRVPGDCANPSLGPERHMIGFESDEARSFPCLLKHVGLRSAKKSRSNYYDSFRKHKASYLI
jgi:hypothetical protein